MTAREASLPAIVAALCPQLSATVQTINIAFKQLPRHRLAKATALQAQSHQEITAREAFLPAPAAVLCPLLSATYQTTNTSFKQLPRRTLAQATALLAESIKR